MPEALETKNLSRTQKVLLPDWHKKVLADRVAKVESGKGKFLTIAQLKKRLAARRA